MNRTLTSPPFQDEWSAARFAGEILDAKMLRVATRREEIITEPQPTPFTTASLIAEAARCWHWSGTHTMNTAQALYESGWITYPRTDAIWIAPSARVDLRAAVIDQFGHDALDEILLPSQATDNGAAENTHEAIRPANPGQTPDALKETDDQHHLYQLIWQRSLASQMKPARYRRITIGLEIES